MSRVVIDSATTTPMSRTTVHNQFDGRAFGFRMLTRTVPIVLNILGPGNTCKSGVLVFGGKAHECVPYTDLGNMEKCCRRVYTFNVKHYLKCFIGTSGTYTWNQCTVCGASIKDGTGKHAVQQLAKLSYRGNRYIYRADKTLQPCSNKEMFTYQEGLPVCE